ncbi:MAG: 1-acyl-sn-glycerol-3-phosphate acyltransferase [Deltaproteobacteria bacterium]|nr:1-acyl-sn-glycerol-3-phosphate acyltransferase [Deltaproteobacteria bacterium]MBW2520878.1 1-acyl-sn-glycerol-3-phosphate acyltransferase [Deltaproteobacteria bacterium]
MTPKKTCTAFFSGSSYHSPNHPVSPLARMSPSLAFYLKAFRIVWRSSRRAMSGNYDDVAWHDSSVQIVKALESVGCHLHVTGMEHLNNPQGPCVFVGNHMSTLETFVLPSLIMPHGFNLTYVVKRSLNDYPVFKHVMRSRNPVVVDRTNPRDDLKVVLEEGAKRLAEGTSLIIFPQHTRSVDFNPEQFNSIAVKLARKAGVPVLPVALLSWAWSTGKWLKDYGPIIPSRTIYFSFGEPMTVTGRGNEAQASIIQYIENKLALWRSNLQQP